jgi:hypothetical protein
MPDVTLISLDKLSEPLTKLVEVVAAGVGKLYEPVGVVRRAKADARAAVILAESGQEIISIERRAAARVDYREGMRQENIENVARIAAGELPAKVSADPVAQDWTTQFINGVQDVSDTDMQLLWARILAGEVARPGTYSKRTLEFLRTLDKWEAEAFSAICSYALQDENGWHCILHSKPYEEYLDRKFKSHGIEYHLTAIGLLMSNMGMATPSFMKEKKISYFGRRYRWVSNLEPDVTPSLRLKMPEFGPGMRHFSQIGQELAPIAGAAPVAGYVEALSRHLQQEYKASLEYEAS